MYMYIVPSSIDFGGMWQRTAAAPGVGPALFKGSFNINETPKDTFIDMEVGMYMYMCIHVQVHAYIVYMCI